MVLDGGYAVMMFSKESQRKYDLTSNFDMTKGLVDQNRNEKKSDYEP